MAGTEWVKNLRAQVLSGSKLTLTWSLDGQWDDLEQRVWCRNSGSTSGEWSYVYDVHEDARSFTWNDCNPGQSYDFCVGARNKGGQWYYGYLYGVPMDALLSLSLSCDVSRGTVKAEWEQNPDADLGYAEVWYRDEASGWSEPVRATGSSCTLPDMLGGRWYEVWVRQRYAAGGYTDKSERIWVPGLENLRWEYAEERTAVKLSWSANAPLQGISGQGTAASAPTEGAWATVWHEDRATPGGWVKVDSWIPATQTSYTVAGLKPGHAYRFCVRIRDFGYPVWQEGMYDNDLYTPFVDMPALSKPKAVSNLRAEYSKSDGEMRVTWRNNEANAGAIMQPYDEVLVYRQADGGAWELASSGSVSESFSESVARGHEYRYKVVPRNGAGDGPQAVSASVKVAAELVPLAVSGLRAAFDARTRRMTVSWGQTETWERPVDEVHVYRQADRSETYEELGSVEGSPYIDQAPEGGHSYRYLVQCRNAAGWGAQAVSNAVEVPPEAPEAPSGVEAVIKGSSATVSWEAGLYRDKVTVQARVNDGAWQEVGSVSGDATSWTGPVAADSSYRFRVSARNAAGESPYSEPTVAAYTKPAAPGKPSAGRAADGIAVAWKGTARWANRQEVQPMWFDAELGEMVPLPAISVGNGTARKATDPAPQTDAPMYYRVRAGIEQGDSEEDWLWSDWSPESEAVMPSSAPNAPAIAAPAVGEVCDVDQGDGARPGGASFAWRHNPTDGSALAKSQVEVSWSSSGGAEARHVATVAGESELSAAFATRFCDLSELVDEHGDEVFTRPWKARVRTMGEGCGEWSPWAEVSFYMRRRPTVSFGSPSADEEGNVALSEYPVRVSLGYDGHGFGESGVELSAADEGGNVVARGSFDGLSFELGSGFWSPRNGAGYVLTATVHSKSGLSGSASAYVTTAFERPKAASLRIECDRERGWVRLTPHVNLGDAEGRRVERLDVWRECGGKSVLVAEGLSDGQECVDRYAPLNRSYVYRLGAYSDQGVYAVTEHEGILRCGRAFVYYGDEGIARGDCNASESVRLTRTRRTLVQYAGRKLPVAYDGGGEGEAVTLGFTVSDEAEADAFREAMACPSCVVKTLSGRVFRATVDVSVQPDYSTFPVRRAVTVECEAVDGDDL